YRRNFCYIRVELLIILIKYINLALNLRSADVLSRSMIHYMNNNRNGVNSSCSAIGGALCPAVFNKLLSELLNLIMIDFKLRVLLQHLLKVLIAGTPFQRFH